MACQYEACRAPDCPQTQGWNVGALCSRHYGEIAGIYPIANKALVDDFIKVHLLLQYNTPLCLKMLAAFETEMQKAQSTKRADDPRFAVGLGKGASYLKLSRALEYYEGYCWFPANRALLSGLLSPDAFLNSVKLGLNKDPGAGSAHGEQSHRLQWHAIMRAATNGFQTPIYTAAKWQHSPLQLFFHYTQGLGKDSGAWGKAMDAQINKGWGNPDRVLADLLKDGGTLVKAALARRVDKMGGPDKQNPVPGFIHAKRSPRDQLLFEAISELATARQIDVKHTMKPEPLFVQVYTWLKTNKQQPDSRIAGDVDVKKVLDLAKEKARVKESMDELGIPADQRTGVLTRIKERQMTPGVPLGRAPNEARLGSVMSPRAGLPGPIVSVATHRRNATDAVDENARRVMERAKSKTSPRLFTLSETYTEVQANLLVKDGAPAKMVEIDPPRVEASRGAFCSEYTYSTTRGAEPKGSKW